MNETSLMSDERTGTPANDTYTPDEFLDLPDSNSYELVDGKLVERGMGARASKVAATLNSFLLPFVRAHQLGHVFESECAYPIFGPNSDRVRRPDCSFITRGRLPNEEPPEGYVRIPPDLAVEVISPKDGAAEIDEKRMEYLQAGVRLVWLIYPKTKSIYVFRCDGTCAMLAEAGDLSGEDVLAGFTCRVADLFT